MGETLKTSETEKAIGMQARVLAEKRAITTPSRVEKILFIGTGSSYHGAQWAHWLCQIEGGGKLQSQAISTWDFLVTPMPHADLYVVLSHRGNKNLTKRALDLLGRRPHVLICGRDAPTGNHPAIFTSPQEKSNAHTMSLMGSMAAASEIVARLLAPAAAARIRRDRLAVARFLTAHPVATVRKQFSGSALHSKKPGSLFFIGGGPAHVIAQELALKAQEMCHLPAQAFQTEQFLHGPLACVEKGDLVVLLPATAAFGAGLRACKSAVREVGAVIHEPHYGNSVPPRAGPSWQALYWLYWGQIFCLATAERRKVNCDIKRYHEGSV